MVESEHRERWLLQGKFLKFGKYIRLSKQGSSIDVAKIAPAALEREPPNKIRELIIKRLATQQEMLLALEPDESSFLPSSFLDVATQRSLAVCRIARYFSLASFKTLVKEELIDNAEAIIEGLRRLDTSIDTLPVNKKRQYLLRVLQEMLLIPTAIAKEIFDITPNQKSGEDIPIEELLKELLEKLQSISANQLSKFSPIAIGTGFLVGGSHLMTNHHVVATVEEARECVAQFNYVQDALGGARTIIEYELEPDLLFVSEPLLDYTLVQLQSGRLKQQPGYTFGWIKLVEDDTNILPAIDSQRLENLGVDDLDLQKKNKSLPGDRVFIIQHPRGERKKIAQSDNKVLPYYDSVFIGGLLKNYIRYTTPADFGSSGAPVLNSKGELVAITHTAIQRETDSSEQETKNENNHAETVYQGVRICRIVEDLKRRGNNNPKLRNFIEDFVVTAEELSYPPLPAALEFDGISSYVNLTGQQVSVPVWFVTAEHDNTITLWRSFHFVLQIGNFSPPNGLVGYLSFTPDGKWLAISLYSATGTENTIEIWELDKLVASSPKPFSSWKTDDVQVNKLTFSPDSKILVTSSFRAPVLTLWSIPYGSLLKSINKNNSDQTWYFTDHSFSSDGKFLATGGYELSGDGKIEIWNLDNIQNGNNLELLDSKTAHGDRVLTISFSPKDTELVASGGGDGKVKLWKWNGKTLELIKDLDEHGDAVLEVNFSPDGNMLASASADKTVHLWNKDQEGQWQWIHMLTGHNYQVNRVEFNADNQTLVSASQDGKVRFWNTTTGSLSAEISQGPHISLNPSIKFPSITLDEQVFIGNNPDYFYSFGGTKPFSLEAWINPISIGVGGVILSKARGLDQGEYILYITEEGNVVFSRFLSKPAELQELSLKTQQLLVTFGKFNHIVATYDGKLMKIYVNGEQEKKERKNQDGRLERDTEGNILLEENSDAADTKSTDLNLPVLVGASVNQQISERVDDRETLVASNFFKGVIAEVKIWNKVLEETEIKSNMYRRLNGKDEKLLDGLIGYWNFEERGHNAEENINNAIPDYPNGSAFMVKRLAASSFTALPLPFGLLFDGQSNYIECSKELNLTDAITVEAWVKHKLGDGLIVSKGGFGEESGYCLFWHQGRIRVVLQDTQRQEKTTIDTQDYAPDDSLWHHIAFTWDSQSQEIDIYIDAQRQDIISVVSGHSKSRLIDGSYKNVGVFEGPIGKSELNLNIGGRQNHGYYFNGAIAEVRLWKTARSQVEIKVNMARRLNKEESYWSDLAGYWRLDDGGDKNTVYNPISDEGDGKIKGEVKWFPETPHLV
ncbi:MAG: hypothetical protein F6K21_07555 [Symploca sp. SIO2D2]|nr:hypothetical protein [Symploca sp. SIO2D2]